MKHYLLFVVEPGSTNNQELQYHLAENDKPELSGSKILGHGETTERLTRNLLQQRLWLDIHRLHTIEQTMGMEEGRIMPVTQPEISGFKRKYERTLSEVQIRTEDAKSRISAGDLLGL